MKIEPITEAKSAPVFLLKKECLVLEIYEKSRKYMRPLRGNCGITLFIPGAAQGALKDLNDHSYAR